MTEEKRLKFSVVREDWSEYRLEDEGSIVKIKVSISEVIDTGRIKGKLRELRFAAKNLFYKEPSPDDKGEPSEDQKISEEDIIEDLRFEKIYEPLNIYDVPDNFIFVAKAQLDEIKKTRKFDLNGDRIFHFGIKCAVNVVPYPE